MTSSNTPPISIPDLSNLILFGYKSCGKTYLGQKLAQRLDRPFLDTDFLIEKKYTDQFQKKLSCREIVKRHGEPFFRLLELEVLSSLTHVQQAVIALGGGALLKQEARDLLQSLGRLIYLDVDKQILKERMLGLEAPAFLDKENSLESFEKMYRERQPIYNSVSHVKVVVSGKDESEVLDELKALADIQ